MTVFLTALIYFFYYRLNFGQGKKKNWRAFFSTDGATALPFYRRSGWGALVIAIT